jgi:hypothetical protein
VISAGQHHQQQLDSLAAATKSRHYTPLIPLSIIYLKIKETQLEHKNKIIKMFKVIQSITKEDRVKTL